MIKHFIRKICFILAFLLILGLFAVFAVNSIVKLSVKDQILNAEDVILDNIDCILVLGCGVNANGEPSHMLADRLTRAVELYNLGTAPKIIMSGDHGQKQYDEVNVMKQFAVDEGIPSEDIFMDHAGFSTYESIYRAKEIFQAKRILVVTQKYHLYRALYIAEQFDLDAYGVASDYHNYYGQLSRDVREVLARVKDCFYCIVKPEPTYLGDVIPVSGDGNVTNDSYSSFS